MVKIGAIGVCLFVLLGFLSVGSDVYALSADKRFEEIKADFLKLRNNDSNWDDVAAWTSLAGRFEAFAAQNKAHSETADAILHSGIIYEQLDAHHARSGYYEKALLAFTKVVERFPKDELADDALLKKGDLLRRLGSRNQAEKCYEAIRNQYRHGDMYEIAKQRLKDIDKEDETTSLDAEESEGHSRSRSGGAVIVLDPGHGGEDFGAAGQGGLLEKDVTLAVALELEKLLRSELEATVFLTRRTDKFVALSERTAVANDEKADLFISLHTNASPKGKLSGLDVYYLDNTNEQGSKTLAERENKSLDFESGGGSDLQFMLSDLIQNAKLDESIRLAHELERGLIDFLGANWGKVRGLGVHKAPFYVLVGAHMPCVLVEMFFIDNATDGTRLAEKRFREDLAFGLLHGIKRFLKKEA
jgi:N-acetylmuramoyl-L-alanine amidase